ncbi:MAG TPA: succinyl-diaminopimelate desuccinylase [Rhodospirillales bacterium]|nr:succinyl-diaminopimelate desuccinylase [Rhodospirillales bacterium]
MTPPDPVRLTRDLVRCPSITPEEAGTLAILEKVLGEMGFVCHRLRFGEGQAAVDNLYARLGEGHPLLAFAGHVDVVPPGDLSAWRVDPFAAEIRDGRLYGRGAADMKSGIAAFVAAVGRWLRDGARPRGAIALLITADEEGEAVNGTRRLLEWAAARGERLDACLVGEPTSVEEVGDLAKIGRRGSLTGRLVVHGRAGHVAYPQRADNAAHRLVAMLRRLIAEPLDEGSAHFEPSSLQVTTIDVGNPASNVIPGRAEAVFNVRFNDRHDRAGLERLLRRRLDACGGRYELATSCSGEAFLTPPGPLTEILCEAVAELRGRPPRLDTSGGTSDARFIRRYCPVVELGIVGRTMHQVDEAVEVEDIERLTRIYRAFVERFFQRWS